VLIFLLLLSLVANVVYALKLREAIAETPMLPLSPPSGTLPTVTVIIPAYNEVDNIVGCVSSVLDGAPPELVELWVVDDQSEDETWDLLQGLAAQLNEPRLKLLAGQPRPAGEVWRGKTWACVQAAERSTADYLLFLDADLRLKEGAIATAVQFAADRQIDLFSLCPQVTCGCFAEWLAQPLIIHTMMIGFNLKAVNDPTTDAAFAAGMFMLFRRQSYEQIGGHRAVADQVVEDVELGRLVKSTGRRLWCAAGQALASVRMYRTGAALWEGWTKNLYSGGQRNPVNIAKFVAVMFLLCVMPWIGLFTTLGLFTAGQPDPVILALSLTSIAFAYIIRRIGMTASGIAPRYWWLTGAGGVLVIAIALTSVLKTETGWGWTWRGRSLKS
jgi:cellulose synthase/poly-beta-1,6-N-acetylglucosamine synthase-like glycosyltransferase